MNYTVSVEARSKEVSEVGDLGDRVLTALERIAKGGRVCGPAVSENLCQKTVGTTLGVQGEADPVRAVEVAVDAFRAALREATGEDAEIIEIAVTREREEAAALA